MRSAERLQKTNPDRIHWIIALFLLLIGTSAAVAQLPTASILGVVKDSSGAVVPDAALTARNSETGQTRAAVAAVNGSFRFSALPVGTYEIKVEHSGFQTEVRKDITLAVGQEAVINFSLQVGAVEQTVSVTGELPLVNTTSGSLGGLVNEERVSDLPLNGRNYMDLTFLQPGVIQNRNVNYISGDVGSWFSSNGAPIRSNNYLLDGAIMQSMWNIAAASVGGNTLGVEGIREWRVVTNSFSAEYGMTMGSQMVIVSKSGTNKLHGSLFEYLRNSALDARNFFDYKTKPTDRRLPAFARNQFGGSIGGPIRKDKTFVFGVFEALRERLGTTQVSNTIPASARVDGAVVPHINPFVRPILDLFPLPNPNLLATNQYTFPFSQPTNENYGQVRVDQMISVKDTLFGRYTIDDTNLTKPMSFPQFRTISASRNQFSTVSEDHVFGPSLLNTARVSFSRTDFPSTSPSGIIGTQYSFMPGREVGITSIAGLPTLGPAGPTPTIEKQNIFTYSDDVSFTRARHSFKLGTLINHYQEYMLVSAFATGQVNFTSVANFLQGAPASYLAAAPGSILDRTYHYNTLGFYLQDDFRATPTFTLNLGMRYEFQTQINEMKGHGSNVRNITRDTGPTLGPPYQNPSLRNLSPRFGFAWDVAGNGKTAVRGGFALLYDVGAFASGLISSTTATPPFSNRSTVTPATPGALPGPVPGTIAFTVPLFFPQSALGNSPRLMDYHVQQPHMLQYNLTVERQLPFGMALTVAYAGSRGLNLMFVTEANPTVPQVLADGRQFWSGSELRTNPAWGTVDFRTAGSSSWYHSLQMGLLKRVSRGLQFQGSYTFSKLIDRTQGQLGLNAEEASNYTYPTDPTHRNVDQGPGSFDITQNLRLNAIYRLPQFDSGGMLQRGLLNGWSTSGIISLQTGFPFSPELATNQSHSKVGGAQGDRPDLLPGRNNGNIILGGPDHYFDPTAFAIQPAGFLGTAGRNILRGPGFATLDFSLIKDIPLHLLGESSKLEFRSDFFNILNRANFVTPQVGQNGGNTAAIVYTGAQVSEKPLSTAGRLTSTASSSRQIQFALKFLF
jgi:carboxypeptidase family protein/TonB-dependent receptor-like protein